MFVVIRSHHNPKLVPRLEHPFEAYATFNWCPVKENHTIHCLYRSMPSSPQDKKPVTEKGFPSSIISHAVSTNGVDFFKRKPFIFPEHDWEKFGCEDPRITKLDGKYYIFYTALSSFPFTPESIKVGVAITKNLNRKILKKHLVTPFNAKAMALFPERINGKIVAILTVNTDIPPSHIAIAEFEKEEEIWSKSYWEKWYQELWQYTLSLRRTNTDHIEVGAPPVKTKYGWLLIYSHIQNYFSEDRIFSMEAFLLDLKDPKKVVARTNGPFMVPETVYEHYGNVPRVIFPTGCLSEGKKMYIYYGAADTTCCTATINLDDFISFLISKDADGRVKRYKGNPIITPDPEHEWEAKATFNPGAMFLKGKTHLLYRAVSKDETSTIGYASTKDGLNIDERLEHPVYVPREKFESKLSRGSSGCEDPRLNVIGNRIYMFYTAFDGINPPKAAVTMITVDDFLTKNWNWTKPIVITQEGIDNKNVCLLPVKVKGKYLIFHRVGLYRCICIDFLDSLDFEKERLTISAHFLCPRRGMWDSKKVGICAPPIKTKRGWIFLYHGVSDDSIYRVGAALLDLKDPTIIISRTAAPVIEPKAEYEKEGIVPNVVFPCGAISHKGKIFLYYGGADRVVGVATIKISDIIDMLT